MTVSNRNGRVLELVLVETIKEWGGDSVILSGNTIIDNQRDNEKIDEMDSDLLEHFKDSSDKIVGWLDGEITEYPLHVDRLTDGSGVRGDVTDVRLTFGEETLNLSIKNNHMALKHQRPGSTPQQFGFKKNTDVDKEYRKEYNSIVNGFIGDTLKHDSNITLFNEVSDTIPDNLYYPVCKLVSDFINEHGKNPDTSNTYFRFLVGNTSFKKVIVYPTEILIQSYDDIPDCSNITSKVVHKSYISVDFHNGIKLLMRLHTASSRLKTGSLKFDTQPDVFDVPTIKL